MRSCRDDTNKSLSSTDRATFPREPTMKLSEFSVTNYRSIAKTEKFNVGDLTVLVGPNNEGKSNLLRALELGMGYIKAWSKLPEDFKHASVPHAALSSLGNTSSRIRNLARVGSNRYRFEEDFPLGSKAYSDGTGTTTIRLRFSLDEVEVQKFKDLTGSANNGDLPIKISMTKRTVRLEISKPGRGNSVLAGKSVQICQRVVEGLDFHYVPALRSEQQVVNLVDDLVARQLRALALDDQYIELADKLAKLRDQALRSIDESLSNSLKGFVPGLKSIRIEAPDTREVLRVRSVLIDDGVETPLESKGDGIKSLAAISLMQESSRVSSAADTFILAVEEPEAHLHPEAVQEIKSRLETIATDRQVILSTHSPILVNRMDLGSNIIVRQNKARAASTRKELRDCLGVRVTDNLESARLAILVEGLTNETVLRAVLADRSALLGKALAADEIAFVAVKGASKLEYQLSSLRTSITPAFVAFDNDDAGRQAIKKATDAKLLALGDHVVFSSPGLKASELENLYDPLVSVQAVIDIFGITIDIKDITKKRNKWSTQIEFLLNTNGCVFDAADIDGLKVRSAELVAADPAHTLFPAWSGIIGTLVERLERRLA